jgi:hypothetical protein
MSAYEITRRDAERLFDDDEWRMVSRGDRFTRILFKRWHGGKCELVYACPLTPRTCVATSDEPWKTVHRLASDLWGIERGCAAVYK